MMKNVEVSQNFTVEDIHKIREYNYDITKNMTVCEKQEYYNAKGMKVHQEIQKKKDCKSDYVENENI